MQKQLEEAAARRAARQAAAGEMAAAPVAAVAAALPLLCGGTDDYWRLLEEANLERYVAALGSHTPRSEFVPMSLEEMRALRAAHAALPDPPSAQTEAVLQHLAERLAPAIKSMGAAGAFVRLSSRSPKDSALGLAGFRDAARRELAQLQSESAEREKETLVNQRILALYRASVEVMRVQDGRVAVEQLTKSARIQEDLLMQLERAEAGGSLVEAFHVVVREFSPLDPTLEFRAFVYRGQLTAITQYNPFVMVPTVQRFEAEICQTLQDFMRELVPSLPLRDCVVDLAIVTETRASPLADTWASLCPRVICIELNPFAEFAGEGLFSWTADKALLMGRAPFECRVRRTVEMLPAGAINPDWEKLLHSDSFWA